MVGMVWEMTTSFVDIHDRNCLTRGSSNYKPICVLPEAGKDAANGAFCPVNGSTGSHWYYPDARQLDQHGKMKMMSNSYERAGTLGFRCVKDVERNPCRSKICSRWSGPPHAFTSLLSPPGGEWARWFADNSAVVRTVKSAAGSSIGSLQVLCPESTAVATTASASYIGISGVNVTAAIGSKCGFRFNVTTDGKGPRTLALFGGATVPLSVSTTMETTSGPTTNYVVKSLALNGRTTDPSALVDTHVHITIDGAEGDVVTVSWIGNTSSPTPAHQAEHFNYTKLKGTKCGFGQPQSCAAGLSSTHDPAKSTQNTAADCIKLCDIDETCSCVVYDSQTRECQKLTRCLLDNAPPPSPGTESFDTYMKDYTVLPGLNCYHGHGAVDIDAQPTPSLTQSQCAERCESDPSCSGAVHCTAGTKKGDCWKRSNIVLSKCGKVPFQTMLIKPTRARAITSNLVLHGASWMEGGAPELPGYELSRSL